jgi:hypothetical protein
MGRQVETCEGRAGGAMQWQRHCAKEEGGPHVTQIFKCKAIFFCKNNFKLDLKNVEE